MRFTDQHLWNIVFSLLFLWMLVYGTLLLDLYAVRALASLSLFELVLIALASFRLTRLFVYDTITAFFRDQFYDVRAKRNGAEVLEKPAAGPRRTLADLVSCPWCMGMWVTATVLFFYLLTPYTHFVIYLLALAAVVTPLQLLANLIGWKAEQTKREVERM